MGNIENAVQALGVDVSLLPDRLETTMLAAVCENLGIDTSTIPDNLKTSFLKAIAKCDISSGGGDGDFPADKYFEGGYSEVNLPNITKLKSYAFYYDTTLKSVSMPKVTSIGQNAFSQCLNLKNVEFPKGLISIGSNAFARSSIGDIEFPNTLKTIDGGIVSSCSQLKAITFKGKPDKIDAYAFSSCSTLTTINAPWAEGEVANAPWGATKATINYNYTGA